MGEAFFLYIPQQIAQRNALFFVWYGNGKQYALLRNYRTDFFDSGLVVLLQQGAADAPHRDITVKHRLHIAAGFRFDEAVAPQG